MPTPMKRLLLGVLLSLLAMSLGPLLTRPQTALAWSPPNAQCLTLFNPNYCFFNYDEYQPMDPTVDNTKFSGPVTTVWRINATGANVDAILQRTSIDNTRMTATGSTEYLGFVRLASGLYTWDPTGGRKNLANSQGWDYHERFFPGVYYNITDGYWGVADTHMDQEAQKLYGMSENAERTISSAVDSSSNCSAHPGLSPCVSTPNSESYNLQNPLGTSPDNCNQYGNYFPPRAINGRFRQT